MKMQNIKNSFPGNLLSALKLFTVKRLRGQKGSTLLEVVLSLGLFGMIGGSFMSGITSSIDRSSIVQERFTAENVASSEIVFLKSLAYDSSSYYPVYGSIPQGYEINIDVVDISPLDYPNTLQKIVVSVYRDNKTVLSVESYKANL
ncbi:MAG: type II secretion system protein [Dehalococcoidia bacterium]|nr:type II secretion system protein [Dehalococcoidia bacterium]MDZ4245807.1 type II secretion system protein [Dehalococcoidia bacterium]